MAINRIFSCYGFFANICRPAGIDSILFFSLNTPRGTSRFGQNQNTDEFNDEALKSLRSADGEDNGIGSVGIGSVGLGAG